MSIDKGKILEKAAQAAVMLITTGVGLVISSCIKSKESVTVVEAGSEEVEVPFEVTDDETSEDVDQTE